MCVAKTRDDFAHRPIELRVGQVSGSASQQGQGLHRICRVRRSFRREVGVRTADRSDQDVQDLEALPAIKIDLPPPFCSASASDINTPRRARRTATGDRGAVPMIIPLLPPVVLTKTIKYAGVESAPNDGVQPFLVVS